MNLKRHHGGWVIVLSFLVSFILTIIPLPAWIMAWRPDWSALILVYWCLAIPQRVGIISGWLVGLILDVLHDSLLGQHGLTHSLIAYITIRLHRRFRLYPLWQQAMGIFILMTFNQLFQLGIQGIWANVHLDRSLFYSATISMILWPWLFILLRDLRRTYHVH
jgi:rod shape-determining protein MreD